MQAQFAIHSIDSLKLVQTKTESAVEQRTPFNNKKSKNYTAFAEKKFGAVLFKTSAAPNNTPEKNKSPRI